MLRAPEWRARPSEDWAALLGARFGHGVLCEVMPVAGGDPALLLPDEREAVAQAVPARRREFAAGRDSARRLLARLGLPAGALLPAGDRSPRWPPGAIGSIAHDETLCAVAVARRGRLASLGLDIEPEAPLEPALWPEICTRGELRMLATQPPEARGLLVRRLFSAKECAYKASYPLTSTMLGFHDVEVELAPGGERFHARFVLDGAALEGFQLARHGSIVSGIAMAGGLRP